LAFAILLIILEFMIGTLLYMLQPLRVHIFVQLHSLYIYRGVSFYVAHLVCVFQTPLIQHKGKMFHSKR